MNKKYDYDLFVIGAGSGGVRAARTAAGYGAKVAIAEQQYLGGTCVNVGCVPKKLFVYASHVKHDQEDARGFGWTSSGSTFDWNTLVSNKNIEIARLNKIYENLLDNAGVKIIEGKAIIEGPHRVLVNSAEYTAERILIATGGKPYVPEFPGHEHVITSNEAFFLETLPEKMIIVGGGYIAVEFSGIFSGLGVEVHQLYRGDLFLRGFDNDLRNQLAAEMPKQGVNLQFNSEVNAIKKQGDVYQVTTTRGEILEVDLVMYATGRKPSADELGVNTTSVTLSAQGYIETNDSFQTNEPSIFALGDVTGGTELTPVATAEAMNFAAIYYGDNSTKLDYSNIPSAVFSQPNLASVGLTEQQAREALNDDLLIFRSEFKHLKHTLSGRDEKTFMKLLVHKSSDSVIGAHMMGKDAGEIIQGVAIAIKAGATKSNFDSTIGIHPTAAEEFVTMGKAAY